MGRNKAEEAVVMVSDKDACDDSTLDEPKVCSLPRTEKKLAFT